MNPDESPLGPIKVVLEGNDIENIPFSQLTLIISTRLRKSKNLSRLDNFFLVWF